MAVAVLLSFRPLPCAPRRILRRRDRALWLVNRADLRRLHGTSCDLVKAEQPIVMCDPSRPIDPGFHVHVGGPDIVVGLIERPSGALW